MRQMYVSEMYIKLENRAMQMHASCTSLHSESIKIQGRSTLFIQPNEPALKVCSSNGPWKESSCVQSVPLFKNGIACREMPNGLQDVQIYLGEQLRVLKPLS